MNEMMERHPTAVWVTILTTIVTIAGAVAGGWWFILDERERSINQSQTQGEIRAEQVLIRRELQSLPAIREVQKQILELLDRRFDNIEAGHDRIVREVTDGFRAIALELGRASACRDGEGVCND